jgi:uncharacterized membrane protein
MNGTKIMENNVIPAYDHSKVSKRLLFIDVIRAYAILMMVQGHVIDSMIDPIYRDSTNWLFSIWDQMRGITAPAFFFSSGTIFSYLLLRKNLPIRQNERFYKGMKRVGILLLIGYVLRFNPLMLSYLDNFDFMKFKSSFAVDALHCIAFGLGLILLSYFIHRVTKIYVWLIFLFFAFTAFYLYPDVIQYDWLGTFPLPIANYFTKEYGSNFPIIPWSGFVMWGALLGYLLSKKANLAFNNIFAMMILSLGIFMHFYSGMLLDSLYNLTSDSNFNYLNNNNFLFYHLGNVLIILGILALISNFVRIPKLLSSIGKKTMMIYVVHIFIIYGTSYNVGLVKYFGQSLDPITVVLAAAGLLIFFISLVIITEKLEPVFQNKFKKYFAKS